MKMELSEEQLNKVYGGAGDSVNLRIDLSDCIQCGFCLDECPVNAIYMQGDNYYINSMICTQCTKCALGCPTEAIGY